MYISGEKESTLRKFDDDHFNQFDKVFYGSERHDSGLCLHISCHAVVHFLSKLNSDAEKIV